jgi:hypothetical protein
LRWINARHFQNTKVILQEEFHGKRLVRNSKADPALIQMLIDQGFCDREIASRMGWTAGTLHVVCSHLKISLRRRAKVLLPQAILDQLNCRAELMSVSSATLAADLLSAIARDNLFNAVLDTDDADSTHIS